MARSRDRFAFIFLILAAGCGGGTEGTGGSAGGGSTREILGTIDPATPISELSSTDSQLVCGTIRDKAQRLGSPETQCRYGAVLTLADYLLRFLNGEPLASDTTGVRSQCERATSACISETPPTAETCAADPNTNRCILDDPRLKECEVRSEIVAGCVLELFEELEIGYSSLTCSALEAGSNGTVEIHPPSEAGDTNRRNCEKLFDQCSGIGIAFSHCNVFVVQ